MAQWESTPLVFQRMIHNLKEAEECARRLALLHEDVRYSRVATLFGNMRDRVVDLAHRKADEKTRMGFMQ